MYVLVNHLQHDLIFVFVRLKVLKFFNPPFHPIYAQRDWTSAVNFSPEEVQF
jgi:hypothetical protein